MHPASPKDLKDCEKDQGAKQNPVPCAKMQPLGLIPQQDGGVDG
jgi:hypothetical protein